MMRAMIGLHPVARMLVITTIIDAVFSVGAGIAWLLVGSVSMPVLAGSYAARVLVCALWLARTLRPVSRAMQPGASDSLVLEADAVLQRGLERFALGFALIWTGSGILAYTITLAAPRVGVELARAELVLIGFGSGSSGLIAYAIVLALMAALSRPLLAAVSRELMTRGLAPKRRARSFTASLRRFLTVFILGVLLLMGSIGGKALVDTTRAQAVSTQLTRAALAVDDLHRGHDLSDANLELVADAALPPVVERTLDDRAASGFDPQTERAVGAVRVDANTWLVAAAKPDKQLLGIALSFLAMVALFGGATYASAAGIAQGVVGSLDALRGATRRVAEHGELRALGRVAPERDDEVGALVHDFNDMLDMLESLTAAAQAVASGDLELSLDHPGDLHDAFRTMLTQLRSMIEQLRDTSRDVSSVSAEIRASAAAQEQAISKLSEDADRAHQTAASLADAARAINDAADGVLASAEQGVATAELVSTRISALDDQARGIGELLEQVREIAERSDLLALNGSLEATRAGEAGRGFALVSAEMRRLAERVTATVVEMRERIAGIQGAGAETVAATNQSRALIEDTARAARDISTLTAEQRANTDEASATSSAIAEFVVEASSGAAQIRAASEGLRLRAAELEQLSSSWLDPEN